MVKKINACIFISGRGSNLKSIIKNSNKPECPFCKEKIRKIVKN